MKLVGIDITKYEHAAFIMNASTGKSLCVPFSSRTIKKVLKNSIRNLINIKKELLISMKDTGHYNFAIENS